MKISFGLAAGALLAAACIVTPPPENPKLPDGAIEAAPGVFTPLPPQLEVATIVVTAPTTFAVVQSCTILYQKSVTTELPHKLELPLPRLDDGSGLPRYLLAMRPGVVLGAVVPDNGQCIRCRDDDAAIGGKPPWTSLPPDRPCCPPIPLLICRSPAQP